jgi:type IV pilus assembly protein PilA
MVEFKKQKGFTLIELMIVIAIIGILMAYAIPAYKGYTIKTKLGEGIAMTAAAKNAVSEYVISEGNYPANNSAAGLAATISGDNVADVQISSGVITVTYSAPVEISGSNVTLTPSTTAGSIKWTCGSTAAAQYVPTTCRN